MGSAARRRGAYGGEYLRVGLHPHARGGRKETKELVKLEDYKEQKAMAAKPSLFRAVCL
jgi:hypothetical protein